MDVCMDVLQVIATICTFVSFGLIQTHGVYSHFISTFLLNVAPGHRHPARPSALLVRGLGAVGCAGRRVSGADGFGSFVRP